MDCNQCNQDRDDYGMGMSGRTSMQNGRNMNYGRGPRNTRMNCGQGMNRYPANGQVMGGMTSRRPDGMAGCRPDGMTGCMSDVMTGCRPDGCDKGNKPVDKMQIAMAYVPWQDWENVCDIDKALEMGTIFEDLYKPYTGRPVK